MTGRVIRMPGEQAVVFVFTAGTLRDANVFGKEAGYGRQPALSASRDAL